MFQNSVAVPRFHGRRGLTSAVAVVLMSIVVHAAETVPGGYAPDGDYGRGSLVIGSDGNVYRALEPVKAKDPVTAKEAVWQLAHVAFDTTLDVPGRFASIEKAVIFLAGATISDSATVTVQVAPGTYKLQGPLSIGHSQGNRVVLQGSKDPSKTRLDFGRSDGIVVDRRRSQRIEGFSIEGEGDENIGVQATNQACVDLRRCVISGFKTGLSAERGSDVVAEGVRVTSKQGTAGFHSLSGSRCHLKDCTASLKSNPRSNELTMGFAAWFSSTMECVDCTATGWFDGFFAGHTASIDLHNCTAGGNRFGGDAYLGSSLRAVGCTFNENQTYGVNVHESTAMLAGCRFRDNKAIALRCYGASMIELRGQPCDISGSELGMQSIAGGLFAGVKPAIRGNGRTRELFQYRSSEDTAFQLDQ
jgi:hypothetical protein